MAKNKSKIKNNKNLPSKGRFCIEPNCKPVKLNKIALVYRGNVQDCIKLLESKKYNFISVFWDLQKDTIEEYATFITFDKGTCYSILSPNLEDYQLQMIYEKRLICDSFEMFDKELGKLINGKLLIK